jgi:transcriptional regulator with XRE-family HTH domain
MVASAFGELFKKLRMEGNESLREFCLKHGYDPGNISKLERGRLAPPQSQDKLVDYGLALGLAPESEEMREFVDTGLTCAGQIPPDVMNWWPSCPFFCVPRIRSSRESSWRRSSRW